jgi:hypothetical protein
LSLNVVVRHLLNADSVSKSATECPSMEINIRHLNIFGWIELRRLLYIRTF